jgi:hypothetical protein
MPRAKSERKPAAPVAPQRDYEYRYRDSDSQSMSITLLTHGLKGDAKVGVLVNGAALY